MASNKVTAGSECGITYQTDLSNKERGSLLLFVVCLSVFPASALKCISTKQVLLPP